jgi:hypothetical protein
VLTGAQVQDSKIFEELVDGVEPVKGPRGRPMKRSEKLHADKGYDYQRCRRFLDAGAYGAHSKTGSRKQPEARSAPVGRGADAGLAILLLCVRYERRADIHEAFLELGCALVCFNRLRRGL